MADTTSTTTTSSANSSLDDINKLYDAKKQQAVDNLESTYQQNLSDAQATLDQIPQTYQTQQNSAAANYERNRQSFNNNAAANGINTGAGSQAQLAMNNQYQQNAATLGASQAAQQAEQQRTIDNLEAQYKIAVQDAIADNDYQRAQALTTETNNLKTQAQTLAESGDFSLYAQMYGQDAADNMKALWMAQNPTAAAAQGNASMVNLMNDYYTMWGITNPTSTDKQYAAIYAATNGATNNLPSNI